MFPIIFESVLPVFCGMAAFLSFGAVSCASIFPAVGSSFGCCVSGRATTKYDDDGFPDGASRSVAFGVSSEALGYMN